MQSFVNAMYQAMKWVKATPIDEVYALVGEKHFAASTRSPSRRRWGSTRRPGITTDGSTRLVRARRQGLVRKGSDIPESKYEDLVDMDFLDAAQAKFR